MSNENDVQIFFVQISFFKKKYITFVQNTLKVLFCEFFVY